MSWAGLFEQLGSDGQTTTHTITIHNHRDTHMFPWSRGSGCGKDFDSEIQARGDHNA
jgi:hypothetical protein